ncbi:MAG: aminotransferase class V-fold PLP-dependent enzyme [Thermoplasmata archaeon YP2-bin.285]|uniref:Aminotransferase class V-fold PLP-dependent enzyme n=1 Tax=Candidatus Sysuiplasma superficiale TaxID=2823368 RepID=A0A8J7YPS9_9ARCH|nr:aminotransferase class V-fold PLP-dependent enzyme [Candidatus Sysuiplasma superficiale]
MEVDDLLERLGVRKVINASGTLTRLGGSRVLPEAMGAMLEVAYDFVDMNELVEKAGSFVAKLVGAEAAYITSGAAAGIVLSVASIMTEGDPDKMAMLPNTDGMKNEVLMQSAHWKNNPYAVLSTIAGAKIKLISNEAPNIESELEREISIRTAAIIHTEYSPDDSLPLRNVVRIARSHGVKVIVDAAAELPPAEALTEFLEAGADAVIFSGGKDISAPNDTGVILGRKDIVDHAMLLGPLSYLNVGGQMRTFIGRPMKTSKEDIVAFVTAFEKYLSLDHAQRVRRWNDICDRLVESVRAAKDDRIGIEKVIPGKGERIRPVVAPRIKFNISGVEPEIISERLKRHEPPVYVNCRDDGIYINPQCLREDEVAIVESALLSVSGVKSNRSTGDVQGLGKGGIYSHFTSAGGLVFVSGISGQDSQAETTFGEQLNTTITKLERILHEAGSSLQNVLKFTVYLSNKEFFRELNDAFARRFPSNPPARTTIVCEFVAPHMKVEIDAVAIKTHDTKEG